MRPPIKEGRALDDAVAAVGATRLHLVDPVEAVVVAESLGYTPERVRRELGFDDTRAFGEFVFERLSGRAAAPSSDEPSAISLPGAVASARASTISHVWYALLWLIAIAVLPNTSSVMLSLIMAGGFVQGMNRRGHFYLAAQQPGLASLTCDYFWRLGAIATIAAAALGMALGWGRGVTDWAPLVLSVDEFVILSAVVLTSGRLTGAPKARRWPWQRREVSPVIPIPRMTVVLLRTLPVMALASLGFAFAFTDRLITLALGFAPFDYAVPMDLAVFPLLIALACVEWGELSFAQRLSEATTLPLAAGTGPLRAAGTRAHLRALATVATAFVASAVAAGGGGAMLGLLNAPNAAIAFAAPCLGYLLLAMALLNARLLITLRKPRRALLIVATGMMVAFALSRMIAFAGATVVPGVALGAGALASFLMSMVAIRAALRRPDHALLGA